MNIFTIKDLENLSGIKAHTIRIWEQRYSFLQPARTQTNIRHYSNEELKKLLNVSLLNKYGYKISHINKMSEEELNSIIISLSQQSTNNDIIVNSLIEYLVDLRMEELEMVLDRYINTYGVEKAILQIMFPFLERIGVLWMTDHINPAQEHLISNLIRQKLIVGIDNIILPIKSKRPVLLFLPEGEHHELGLLFVDYLLKCRGINTIYLGANIPFKDVEYVIKLKGPAYLYCHLIGPCENFNFEKFISGIDKRFASTPIVISGNLVATYTKKIPKRIILKRSFAEVEDFIAEISHTI